MDSLSVVDFDVDGVWIGLLGSFEHNIFRWSTSVVSVKPISVSKKSQSNRSDMLCDVHPLRYVHKLIALFRSDTLQILVILCAFIELPEYWYWTNMVESFRNGTSSISTVESQEKQLSPNAIFHTIYMRFEKVYLARYGYFFWTSTVQQNFCLFLKHKLSSEHKQEISSFQLMYTFGLIVFGMACLFCFLSLINSSYACDGSMQTQIQNENK